LPQLQQLAQDQAEKLEEAEELEEAGELVAHTFGLMPGTKGGFCGGRIYQEMSVATIVNFIQFFQHFFGFNMGKCTFLWPTFV